jgi:hypothetical protein
MVAIGVLVAAVVVGIIYVFVAFGHHSGSGGSGSAGNYQANNGGYGGSVTESTVASDPGSGDQPAASPSLDSTAPHEDSQTYSGPGGITVQGPAGWHRDRTAHVPSVADYDAPGSSARLAGSTFRIGISNPTPTASLRAEAKQAANFLRSSFHAAIIGITYRSFLGTECADIQYRYYNATYHVERRGIERIWHDNNETYTIQSSGAASDWSGTEQVLAQLVTNASVS